MLTQSKRMVIISALLLAAGQMMSMEDGSLEENQPQPRQLGFVLNAARCIKAHSATGGMKYFVEPSEFEGRDITTAIPLATALEQNLLITAVVQAQPNKDMRLHCVIGGDRFRIKIITQATMSSYFVSVEPVQAMTEMSPVECLLHVSSSSEDVQEAQVTLNDLVESESPDSEHDWDNLEALLLELQRP
jgi:hypothetical protein